MLRSLLWSLAWILSPLPSVGMEAVPTADSIVLELAAATKKANRASKPSDRKKTAAKKRSTPKSASADQSKSSDGVPAKSRADGTVDSGTKSARSRRNTRPVAAARPNYRARLPRYFGKLELDDQQRKEVITIRQRFDQQIWDLRQQITQLQADCDQQSEAVLTTTQKRLLKKLRAGPTAK